MAIFSSGYGKRDSVWLSRFFCFTGKIEGDGHGGYCFFLIILVTSIWAAVDASNLQAYKYKGHNGAFGTFFACLLFWIVCFPYYLVKRKSLLNQTAELKPYYAAMSDENAKKEKLMAMGGEVEEPIFTLEGVQDIIALYANKITITPKGIIGLLNKGLKGTKTIPISSISAIQIKLAGSVLNGYIQFTIPGGKESTKGLFGAVSDENTFVFLKKDNESAQGIKNYIENRILGESK